MSIRGQYLSILNSVKIYEDLLANISEEVFLQSPPNGGWSYSEVYSHIFQSNLMSLIAIDRCVNGTGVLDRKWTPVIVKLILLFGIFPPGKFKAPAKLAAMVQKISMEDARNLIVRFKQRLGDFEPKVSRGNKYQKVKHPRLGLLNARQWFRFIEIHTKHHTKQLTRIRRDV